MSNIFSGSPDVTKTVNNPATVPIEWEQPFTMNASGDTGSFNVGYDPSTNNFDVNTSTGLPSLIGNLDEMKANRDAFVSARVSPYQDALDRRIADVTRSMGRRGVMGSLANNEINNAMYQGTREIADQTALARTEALNYENSLKRAAIEAELATMGLGAETLNALLGNRRQVTQAVEGSTTTTTQGGGGGILDWIDIAEEIYGSDVLNEAYDYIGGKIGG